MTAAFLYLILGLGLMLFLGRFLGNAVYSWLEDKLGDAPEDVRSWRNLAMAGYYLLFSGYLVMTAQPLSYSTIAEMVLLVIGKLGPMMLVIGGLAGMLSWIRLRNFGSSVKGVS